MKITSIDVYDFGKCLNYEDCSPICIRINTDAGISGFGEVGLAYGNAHNAGVWMVKDFGQLIIGMDPLRSEAIREKLFRTTFWGMGGGTVINAGMSAIDIALWDIKGKYYNAPVYQLLGGKINEKLRAYASQIQFDWDLEVQHGHAGAVCRGRKEGHGAGLYRREGGPCRRCCQWQLAAHEAGR